jgi:hypothetical protein
MPNAMLRKQARHLYWKNRWLLLLVFLFTFVVNITFYLVHQVITQNGLLVNLITYFISFAATPVTVFGVYHILLSLVRGKKVRFTMLFDYYKQPYKLIKIYAASFIVSLSYTILLIFSQIQQVINNVFGQGVFIAIYIAFAILLYFWLALRFFLFSYLFITEYDEHIWALIQMSFLKMKGQVRHVLWLGFTVYLPLAILYLSMLIASFYFAYTFDYVQTALLLNIIVIYLISVLFTPYILLTLTGYADGLLQPAFSKKEYRKSMRLADQAKQQTDSKQVSH